MYKNTFPQVSAGKFTAFTKSVATGQKLKQQTKHIKKLCKHMEIVITGSDLPEEKLPQ